MRHDDWQVRYHAAVSAVSNEPFEWGVHDCVTFACKVYEAISYGDAAMRMRDQFHWSGQLTAAKTLNQLGGLRAACERVLGPGDDAWLKFGKGDIVLAKNADGEQVLCVHDGTKLLAPGPIGLVALPLRTSICGWGV